MFNKRNPRQWLLNSRNPKVNFIEDKFSWRRLLGASHQ